VKTWLRGHVAARNLSSGKLDDPLPYALPDHALALGGAIRSMSLRRLQDVEHLAANANMALSAVAAPAGIEEIEGSHVRCWPHHFDFDTLVELGRGRTMGLGYCPGDEFCDEPYFYTSMWPEPSIPKLPLLPAMAHWHTYKFLARSHPRTRSSRARPGRYVRQSSMYRFHAALDALG